MTRYMDKVKWCTRTRIPILDGGKMEWLVIMYECKECTQIGFQLPIAYYRLVSYLKKTPS